MLFSALYSALRLVIELIKLQTRDTKAIAGRGARPAPTGQGAGAAGEASSLAAERSADPERAAGAAAQISLGRTVSATGDGAGLASQAGAEKVGGLSGATPSGATAAGGGMPAADPADGGGESDLGLLPHSRRVDEARLHGLGDCHPVGAEASGPLAGGPASRADVEAVPGCARETRWWQRTSSPSTLSS